MSQDESLIVLSDVHLGSDLNDHMRSSEGVRRSQSIDDDLVRLIDHYRQTPPSGERWRIVIAGDFIDFIGITIQAESDILCTELSDEERAHGLGSAADHGRVKLRRVAERHRAVFTALAKFVAVGNAFTLVHGNHDVEFHWDAVKDEFRELLIEFSRDLDSEFTGTGKTPFDPIAFKSRIEFHPWFFYRGGVVYIEHGHQYDAFCAHDFVMAPLSPLDPRRIASGFCDVLLRYVVRPTKGLKEYGHETMGVFDYFAIGAKLGVRGSLTLAVRFARAIIELFRLRRAYFTEAAERLREEHERRLSLVAEATRIGVDKIRALAALQAPPVTRSVRGILASVLLDRLALGLACIIALFVAALVGLREGYFLRSAGIIAFAWAALHRHLASQRMVDPADALAERAAPLARLFPAAFVIMGHTHVPMSAPVKDSLSTYINVGSWAEEEDENDGQRQSVYRAARTHLVIRPAAKGPVAEFLTWEGDAPRLYQSLLNTSEQAKASVSSLHES